MASVIQSRCMQPVQMAGQRVQVGFNNIMTPDCKANLYVNLKQYYCRSTVFTQNSKVQTNGQYKYEGYSGIKMNCKSNERNVKTLSRPFFSIPKIYTLEKCWLVNTKMIEW